jgi:digeranylgeranylglycerophospholipid reductase
MKDHYDIVVVGGGPAGSWTAKHAAEKGASVLVVEKDREIGLPVRCAEGVGANDLARAVEVKPEWISSTVTSLKMAAPDGTVLEAMPGEVGYVLDRKRFDAGLAAVAARAGAEVSTKAYVVVGADGVESRVGRWAGLHTMVSPEDMSTCIQFTLAHESIVSDIAELRVGKRLAPGGYLWVFPKGGRTANVGLGITGSHSLNKKPIFYLREYVERTYPDASILTIVAGGVPVGNPIKDIVSDGLMLVGDAARQANPLTGGGIVNAMLAGKIAGRVAAEAVQAGDPSKKRLSEYAKEWHKLEGRNNELFYKIRIIVERMKDEDLNTVARVFGEIPPEKRTHIQLFKTLLFKHPKMLLEFGKVYLSELA